MADTEHVWILYDRRVLLATLVRRSARTTTVQVCYPDHCVRSTYRIANDRVRGEHELFTVYHDARWRCWIMSGLATDQTGHYWRSTGAFIDHHP